MPRFVAENIPTVQPVLASQILVNQKEVVVKTTSIQSGTLNFVNSKKSIVTFVNPFQKVPRLALTPLDASVANFYVTSITETGFTCNLQNNWSGQIDWIAIERE